MRKSLAAALIVLAVFFSFGVAHSGLVDNGNGLIYDTDLNITWYDFTHTEATWNQSANWASSLRVGEVTGWRLPQNLPVNGSGYNYAFSANGSTDNGYNITSKNSELAYLYHIELNNKSILKPDGKIDLTTEGYANSGPFVHLLSPGTPNFVIWSSSDSDANAWVFYFSYGYQGSYLKINTFSSVAVHDGNIGPNGPISSVPEPGAIFLFAPALVGLVALKRKYIG